jgi:hypothetical protein
LRDGENFNPLLAERADLTSAVSTTDAAGSKKQTTLFDFYANEDVVVLK